MLVSTVGIILFPFTLWDGSRFMAEKFVGALLGFFIKLLLCNVCVFIMLYGFLSLAATFTANPFTGLPDEIITIIFSSLLFFFITKSAPALAQSLLTGSPSLTGQGAIAAVAGGVAAAATAGGIMKSVAGGAAKGAFNMAGAATQMAGAAKGAKEAGGGARDMAGAAFASLKNSAGEGVKSIGHDLSRSLLGGGGGGGGAGGAGGGMNTHSRLNEFNRKSDKEGLTLSEHFKGRGQDGKDMGKAYMNKNKESGASGIDKNEPGAF
jgi:type IV secretory pathway TrbL component